MPESDVLNPSKEALALLSPEVLHTHRVVPFALSGDRLEVAVDGLPSRALIRELAFLTGCTVVPVQVEAAALDALLAAYAPADHAEAFPYPGRHKADPSRGAPQGSGPRHVLPRTLPVARKITGSVVQQVDQIIQHAIEAEASDIHIEPYEAFFRVRYRLDGVLYQVGTLSMLQKNAIISRLKVMAALDIAEKRRPQDGRIRFRMGAETIDLRVSTLPTDFGEKVVLRILDQRRLNLDLNALGFSASDLHRFQRAIQMPYGMVLVTGPTGSGKTTTLYAALNALNTPHVNITTIEDPIEYNLPGINQTHVRADIGFTFAHALRAFLRQDPNIVMVGEIRDGETASIAIRAALTGHLVLSTLHTNDASATVTRLIDMGMEPFLVASSVRLVVAQRLVRCICPDCKEAVLPEVALLDELGISAPPGGVYRGQGCSRCNETGYRGRTALFEVMPMSESLSELVSRRSPMNVLRAHIRSEGGRSLRVAALEKAYAGVTTLEEVLRETGEG